MPLRCQSCFTLCPDVYRFCGNCGTPLAAVSAAPSAAVPEIRWGGLKHATIVFADISSSSELVEALDAEQAMDQLRPAVQAMCHAIERFGGTVVRTLGDGIMALFGAPLALEGHARLACEAALAMQQSFAPHPQGLRIRIGLHTGQVALDADAADASKGGGVHGHALHLASRVVALAEPGGICLTAACHALVSGSCEAIALGCQQLKGAAEPIEIYRLLAMKSQADNGQMNDVSLSPFRGRAPELALLQDALASAEKAQGQVLGLSGSPGAGKSRLCREFAQLCSSRQIPLLELRTELYGHATPLQSVLALLRTGFFNIREGQDAAQSRQQVSQTLALIELATPDDALLMHEFLGILEAGQTASSLSPKLKRARLLELLRLLVKNVGKSTRVIVFEDLHWLDEASTDFLVALGAAVAGTHWLLLLNFRTGYAVPWPDWPHFRSIVLGDLSTLETENLVKTRLMGHPALLVFLPLVVARAAGNPFFAEELVSTLIEKTAALNPSGQNPPDIAALSQALPATVQAVIGERIDRLVGTQKSLLHICAVIGKEIPLSVLQQVAVYLVSQMESSLDALCQADMLKLLRDILGGKRFAFRHPLIQEVAYSTQLKARRANLHAAVAVAMQTHYSAQPGEFAALIAYHFEAAEQPVEAAVHEAAAAKWLGSTNSAQAIKHWRKVWTLLDGQEPSVQVNSLRAMAGGRIVFLGWREGINPQEAQQIISEAIDLAHEADTRLVQLLLYAQGRILQSAGGPADDYVACIQRALALSQPAKDVGRDALLHIALSQAYAWAGLLREGLAASDVAMAGLAQIDSFDRAFMDLSVEQWALGVRARLLIKSGCIDDAKVCLAQMLAADDPAADPVMRQITHHLHVELAAITRDTSAASHHAGMVSTLAAQYASPYAKVFTFWCVGIANESMGNLAAAQRSFSDALACIDQTQVGVEFDAEIKAGLADCQYKLGNLEQALTLAHENLAASERRSNRVTQYRSRLICAQVLALGDAVAKQEAALHITHAVQLMRLTGAAAYEGALRDAQSRVSLNANRT